MKKHTEIATLLLTFCLGSVSVTGCADKGKKEDKTTEYITTTQEITTEEQTQEAATTEAVTTGSATEPTTRDPDAPYIEEQVIWETDMLKVVAKELEILHGNPFYIRLSVKNKTYEDFDLVCDGSVINGFSDSQCRRFTLRSLEENDCEIPIYGNKTKSIGCEKIGEIKLSLHTESLRPYDLLEKSGLLTFNASDIDKEEEIKLKGLTLFDQDGIRIMAVEVDSFDEEGATLIVYMENNTDKDLKLSGDEYYVNGYKVDGFVYNTVYAGTKSMDYLDFYYYDNPDKEKIGAIDDLGVSFRITDNNDEEDNDLIHTDVIKFSARELDNYDEWLKYVDH